MTKNMDASNFKDLGGTKLADMTKNMDANNFQALGGTKLADMTKKIGRASCRERV